MTTPRIEEKYHHVDHTHCWQEKNPPCGQKIDHLKCCLCEMPHPEIAKAHQAGKNESEEDIRLLTEEIERLREDVEIARKAGIDEAVEIIKGKRKKKNSIKHFSGNGYYNQQGYNKALDDTIKALQNNK